ncbi:MAG: hypothetical protein ACYDBZ_20950 [Steroidobacteraceae bacterium]
MPLDGKGPAEGIVSLQRQGITYTGQWATTGNRIFVYWEMHEDSALLGMFDKEPETLARILLSDLVNRKLTNRDGKPKLP